MPIKPGKYYCKKHLCHWCGVGGTDSADAWCSDCNAAQKEVEDVSNKRATEDKFDNPVFDEHYQDVDDDIPIMC